MTIENTGRTPVVNPRIVTNDERRWWSVVEIARDFTSGAADDMEKALLIWYRFGNVTYHDDPLFTTRQAATRTESCEAVRTLNVYGFGMCGNLAESVNCIYRAAGLSAAGGGKEPHVLALNGHVMSEPWVHGGYRFLDVDMHNFVLDRDNETVISSRRLAHDHELGRRDAAYGPPYRPDLIELDISLHGSDDKASEVPSASYRMEMILRPGEKMVYRWDNIGKVASDGSPLDLFGRKQVAIRYFGNSRHVFRPRLGADEYKAAVFSEKDLRAEGGALGGASAEAEVVYHVQLPYVACGGALAGAFALALPADRVALAVSLNGQDWQEVWAQSGPGAPECRVNLDDVWTPIRHAPIYAYYVKVRLASARLGGARLKSLSMETDVMCAPMSLPRLRLGGNRVEYSDETEGPREVSICYRWQETKKPVSPATETPISPASDATVRRTTVDFAWPATPGAQQYHVQVSRYADMRLPYRPIFNVYIKEAQHLAPTGGLFNPDTDYYWRVRVMDRDGVWSRWSRVWRFRWEGPLPPVNVRPEVEGRAVRLWWQPNERGPRPVAYDVYGSDERGFSVHREAYRYFFNPSHLRPEEKDAMMGPRAPNFVARTTDTSMLVVGDVPGASNTCFYRVVAVDAADVESGCSDYVEMKHPFVYSAPAVVAKVGQAYSYPVRTLRCDGDIQYRDGTLYYAEKEEYGHELVKGPAWLKLDRATGVLAGTPGSADAGVADVEVRLTRTYPYESRQPAFSKSEPQFRAEDRQAFQIRVVP
ncbi:MAG: hypothetical protein FJ272_05545 [Planctomycetes bacterium]|nr:hypothetical protein [Planctomycetota bacterium]